MTTDLATVSKRLPPDLRVGVSEDADIERVVEFQNRWATPSSWMSPASARRMTTANPEPDRLTLIVEDRSGAIQAVGSTGNGGLFASPDGSWRVGLRVAPEWRRRGVARSLLEQLDDHARTNKATRLGSSARDLRRSAQRARSRYRGVPARAAAGHLGDGPRRPVSDADAEQPPPFENAKRMFFEGPGQDPPSTIYALRDGHPVATTATMVKETSPNAVAYTNFTGVSRAERGKGIALAMKLRALRELRARGVKLFGTTNDEQNAAMRGINRKLGYKPEPPTTMYERRFS